MGRVRGGIDPVSPRLDVDEDLWLRPSHRCPARWLPGSAAARQIEPRKETWPRKVTCQVSATAKQIADSDAYWLGGRAVLRAAQIAHSGAALGLLFLGHGLSVAARLRGL